VDRPGFASLRTAATAAKVLVAVAVLVDLAAAVTSFRLLHLADDAQQLGQSTLYYDAESLERTHALVRTLQLGVYAVGGLVLALWFARMRGNVVWPARLVGAAWRMFALGAFLVVCGSFFWSSWVDGSSLIQLEVAALAQLVGNLLGLASTVLAFVVLDRASRRPLHPHSVESGVDVERRSGDVARIV
jgi:hypothetical protein